MDSPMYFAVAGIAIVLFVIVVLMVKLIQEIIAYRKELDSLPTVEAEPEPLELLVANKLIVLPEEPQITEDFYSTNELEKAKAKARAQARNLIVQDWRR